MSEVDFPRYNSLPPRFLFLAVDQTVIFATSIVIGALGGYLALSVTAGGLLAWLLGRWRDSRPDGYLQHIAYWYGFVPIKARCVLNPFMRFITPL